MLFVSWRAFERIPVVNKLAATASKLFELIAFEYVQASVQGRCSSFARLKREGLYFFPSLGLFKSQDEKESAI